MKRLVGGDYQLDLSPIEIEESVDGETYTSITDKSVLDQLTGLKAFIGKSGMIKPIWVKLLNGETDEIVATRGSLSTSDGTTFLIKILLVGFILTLSVEFTQAETEDHVPLDEWYIDDNDAKYILISEAQEIGAISELPVFENIVDKDGHKRFVEGSITMETVQGITQTYGKWSLSGSHLLIVLCGNINDESAIAAQTLCKIKVPAWTIGKLIPLFSSVLERKTIPVYSEDTQSQNWGVQAFRDTVNNELGIYCLAFTATADRKFRISFDFLIDNE